MTSYKTIIKSAKSYCTHLLLFANKM